MHAQSLVHVKKCSLNSKPRVHVIIKVRRQISAGTWSPCCAHAHSLWPVLPLRSLVKGSWKWTMSRVSYAYNAETAVYSCNCLVVRMRTVMATPRGCYVHLALRVLAFSFTCFLHEVPPSVVISQNTFKGFPFFSGSIQYSPSPLESPTSQMCLQESPGFDEK